MSFQNEVLRRHIVFTDIHIYPRQIIHKTELKST
jgi:hypothetical protein